MLHGPPGTGKANYLLYLINEIQNKELIYVPPDLVNVSHFTQKGFVFQIFHLNSIIEIIK
jgi:hypothetical protein